MRFDGELLSDILESIESIERYAAKGAETFYADELVQTWIVHHIQIIGEAARRLSDDLRNSYPEVPWSAIIGMRNILVHDYFDFVILVGAVAVFCFAVFALTPGVGLDSLLSLRVALFQLKYYFLLGHIAARKKMSQQLFNVCAG